MKNLDFLKNNLRQSITVEPKLDKAELENRLRQLMDYSDGFSFLDGFDVFSNSSKTYKGKVYEGGFEIRRKAEMFGFGDHFAFANGRIKQDGGKLIVDAEVETIFMKSPLDILLYILLGFHGFAIVITFLIALFSLSPLLLLVSWIFIAMNFSIFFGIIYFLSKRAIDKLVLELRHILMVA